MNIRDTYLRNGAAAGIAAIVAAGKAPAQTRDTGMIRIGQIGLGGHNFLASFTHPPKMFKGKVRAKPHMIWDEYPGAAEAVMDIGFEKIARSPEELFRECDAVHFEHADYRKALEFTRAALEAGKPVFYDRPFAFSIADAEEIIRLAKAYNAPVMAGSSLEHHPSVAVMQAFARDAGPVRMYHSYCPEPIFSWMFTHAVNFAHAGLGGGIESAFFSGGVMMSPGEWVHIEEAVKGTLDLTAFPKGYRPDYAQKNKSFRPVASGMSLLTYLPRNGGPPMIGMNLIGEHPAPYQIEAYAEGGTRTFTADGDIFGYMFLALHAFYADRKIPRPYEAVLEQHRVLAATNVSRLSGTPVRLDSLGGSDNVGWHDDLRNWLVQYRIKKTH